MFLLKCARSADSFSARVGPPQAERNCPAIVFTLDRILLTAKIESKHFVVQIQQRDDRLNSARAGNAVAGLRVHLRMGIEVLVTIRPLYPEKGIVQKLVRPDIRIVVCQPHASRDGPLVVGRVEIPVVGCLAQQRWMVGPSKADRKTGSRGCVAVVRGDSHTAQKAWKRPQVLFPGHLDSLEVGAGSVNRSSYKIPGERTRGGGCEHIGVDGIAQGLVEPAGLNYPNCFQIVFNQDVEIVSVSGY